MPDDNQAAGMAQSSIRTGERGVLRFITCGSVDDGKSTLIGRMLFDSKLLFEDQIARLQSDSKVHGTAGDDMDFALLLDGLEAEREQGITIDVAYRFFQTGKRKFITADTPGHEQYTRNMVTGASTADLAIILLDARKGVLTQTRRHSYIVSMMGIRHVVLAVNKMDLVGYDQALFEEHCEAYAALADNLGFISIVPIPISARHGDNVFTPSSQADWYQGQTLVQHLESVDVDPPTSDGALRLPVQWVNRPNQDFRGFAGNIAAGQVALGDEIVVAHSGKTAKVTRIVTADADLEYAGVGEAVTLLLDQEIDISRGDMLASPNARPEVSSQFAAQILWMSEDPMLPGRSYLLKAGGQTTRASVTTLKHKVDVNTFGKQPGTQLGLNEIGVCTLSTSSPVAFDPYTVNRDTGSFILIDRITNQTVAAGMIAFSLHRASNVHRQAMDVSKAERAQMKGQKPAVLWFTGLSGAGKSTIANLVEARLTRTGLHTYALDGDNVRHGLNRDLGFTDADRVENIRRIGEVARLMIDAGLIVTCSFISPFRSERAMVRELLEPSEFVEIFVDAPLETCMERDVKGLYRKAREGKIKNFTGFDSPYEAPEAPELHLKTDMLTPDEASDRVVQWLVENHLIG